MKASFRGVASLVAAVLLPAALHAAAINGTVVGPDSTTAVASATVILSQAGTGGGARTPVDTVQTDAQGKFSFASLAAAQNYGVNVTAAGFVAYVNTNVDLGTDTTVAALTIRLAAVPPPADIAGTVRNGVDSTALAGATVVLSQPGTGGGARVPLDTATTNAQGAFSFPDLAAADNYGIAVSATGFSSYANTNIDLEGRDTALVINLLPPADIGGTVLTGADAASAPAEGATVVLTRAGTGGGGARTAVDTATTDAQGKFTFVDLPSMENYGVTVTATGFAAYTNNNIDLRGRDTSVTINLLGPADISGTVLAGIESTSPPVANATVILTQPGTGGGGARTAVDTATTDAQGKFTFPDLASMDNYGLTVTATGLSTYTNTNIDLRGRDTSLTINLLGPADINGTVLGADSTTAVANATVVLTRSGTGGGGARTPVDTATTDAQGKFAFPDLTSMDNYGVTVTATGFGTFINNNIDLRGRDTSVTVVLQLPPPPGTISGVVRGPGGATAAPVANATVVLNQPGTAGGARTPIDTTQTNAQGVFTFTGIPAGDNYGLVVTATGFNPATNNNVDLDGGDTATANFNLVVTASVLPGALRARGLEAAWTASGLSLTLPPASIPRTVSVYSMSGSLRHRVEIPAGARRTLLPADALRGRGLLLELKGLGMREILPLSGR